MIIPSLRRICRSARRSERFHDYRVVYVTIAGLSVRAGSHAPRRFKYRWIWHHKETQASLFLRAHRNSISIFFLSLPLSLSLSLSLSHSFSSSLSSYLGASGLSKLLDVFKIPLEGRFDRFSAIIIERYVTTVTHTPRCRACMFTIKFHSGRITCDGCHSFRTSSRAAQRRKQSLR